MTAVSKARLLDFGFVTALLLTLGIPLIGLRASPVLFRPGILSAWAGTLLGLVALWVVFARRWRPAPDTAPPGADQSPREGRWSAAWHTLLIAGLLAAITYIAVVRPLRQHFWMGGDEFLNFQPDSLLSWMHDWDRGMNRPLTVLTCATGRLLTPGRIDALVWLGPVMCWLNGLLLFAVVRELLPRARLFAAAAAVLLVVDRSEPTRFFVMCISNNYWMALAWLQLGGWLFLRSYRLGSRPLLALSCAALAASLMMFEAGYPLAVLVPGLAWLVRAPRRRLPLWGYAWGGTLALFATRFLLFMLSRGESSYQATQLTAVRKDPAQLLANLKMHLTAGVLNFQSSGGALVNWEPAAAVLALAAVLVGLAAWRTGGGMSQRRYLVALPAAVLALLLGTVAFLPMGYITRTQYFAAPGLAALVAGGLCLAGSLLGRRLGKVVVAAAVGLLAANATGESTATQARDRSKSPACFERTAHVYRQIHALCPNPDPDTLFLVVPTSRGSAPLGGNYACLAMSPQLLGCKLLQACVKDGCLEEPVFGPDAVLVGPHGSWCVNSTYDKVVAFALTPDGTVTLRRRLPRWLVPGGAEGRYDPLARLRPGPVKELPYFRYPRWAPRPRDLFAMADGVMLGAGWGPLEFRDGVLSRQASDGAELAVNSLGKDQRELCLRVEAEGAERLEAVDLAGKIVATAALRPGEDARLTVPTDPARVSVLRLRAVGEGKPPVRFRAYCPGGKVDVPALNFGPPDIAVGDLELGGNWHVPEFHQGEAFRWVPNDAEVSVERDIKERTEVFMVVEQGPGLGGKPGAFSVRDQAGRVLQTATIRGRVSVRVPLAAGTAAGTVFRLHVENGGHACPPDTRILNFRVLNCVLPTE